MIWQKYFPYRFKQLAIIDKSCHCLKTSTNQFVWKTKKKSFESGSSTKNYTGTWHEHHHFPPQAANSPSEVDRIKCSVTEALIKKEESACSDLLAREMDSVSRQSFNSCQKPKNDLLAAVVHSLTLVCSRLSLPREKSCSSDWPALQTTTKRKISLHLVEMTRRFLWEDTEEWEGKTAEIEMAAASVSQTADF